MKVLVLLMVLITVSFAQLFWTEYPVENSISNPRSIYAIDLDSDGNNDVIGEDDVKVIWYENNGGSFTPHTLVTGFLNCYSVYAIDLDSDGNNDVLASSILNDDLIWFKNDGSGNFTKYTIDANYDGAYNIYAIDLDSDTDIDIVCSAFTANDIAWYENDGSENFTKHMIEDNISPANIHAIDLDGDTDIDVLGAGNNLFAWYENDGSENFTKHMVGDSVVEVYAIDLDGDGDNDILGSAIGSGKGIAWYENGGTGNFTKHLIEDTTVSSIYALDLDGDTDIDILSTRSSTAMGGIIWWENDGAENFTKHFIKEDFPNANSVYVIDLDGDGDHDIIGSAAGTTDKILWWRNSLIRIHDVGVISIDIPLLVHEDTTLNPHATIMNFGKNSEMFNVTCTIEPGLYISNTVCYLLPGENIQVTFPDQFRFVDGSYTVTVYTRLNDDLANNDTLKKVIETITIDVGTISIDIPSNIPEDSLFNPLTTVKNMGDRTESFSVKCIIQPDGMSEIEPVYNLAPGESIQVSFTPFLFADGPYTVTVYTLLGGDGNPANDTLVKVVDTYDPGIVEGSSNFLRLFSFGLEGNLVKGKVLFNLELPQDGLITLRIYDTTGRLVGNLSSYKSAGCYQIPWSTKVNGVYFYTFESSGHKETGKLVIVQ